MRINRKNLKNRLIKRALDEAALITAADIAPGQMSPLAYLLREINDETVPKDRRDRLAIAAAPYCHPRLMPQRASKKDQATKAAFGAGLGTGWTDDLDADVRAS
jgi:hypothetical protein